MEIIGNKISLMPAKQSDREEIYDWLCNSDITSSVMGPPLYPDHPIPTYKEFCDEYPLPFFNDSGNGIGRVFIINANDEKIGTIGYDLLDKRKDRVVLDIWMKSEEHCGHGHGSYALNIFIDYIHKNYGITQFIISPSERNRRAIAAYNKVGFKRIRILDKKEQEKEFGLSEYKDNLLMIKRIV